MPFDISSDPASFTEYINKILADELDIFFMIYLDDILNYPWNPRQPQILAERWVM